MDLFVQGDFKGKNNRKASGSSGSHDKCVLVALWEYTSAYALVRRDNVMQKLAFITWEVHRRTEGLAQGLGVPLITLQHEGARYTRYPSLALRTIWWLVRLRPDVLIFQNPSLVLALLLISVKPVFRIKRLVMDAHNEAVRPFSFPYAPIRFLSRLAIRSVNVTVVTNSVLAGDVQAIGGSALVLPDRLPAPPIQPLDIQEDPRDVVVMVVASFAADEPIQQIIDAATILGDDFQFRITGKKSRCPLSIQASLPGNVLLTDYLDEQAYWQLMSGSHIVLDLTLKPDCLVCGAYEALALGRPMVLSDNGPTAELFGEAAVLCRSAEASDIVEALQIAKNKWCKHVARVQDASRRYQERWQRQASAVRDVLLNG